MPEFKYKIPVHQIVDEAGTLKFIYNYNTNIVPEVGDTIVNLVQDEEGKFVRRIYFGIKDRLLCTVLGEQGQVNDFAQEPVVLHVELLVDEPVLNI